VAGRTALLAGMGLGVLLVGGAAGSADTYRVMQIMPSHLPVPSRVGEPGSSANSQLRG
jgi:hypothetical protein